MRLGKVFPYLIGVEEIIFPDGVNVDFVVGKTDVVRLDGAVEIISVES
jgi:hypothetical protein